MKEGPEPLPLLEAWALRAEAFLGIPAVTRLVSVFLALGTGTVIGIAAWLQPSPEGHGTHLQLGLGQCTFLQLTGQPCPMCGATTTFTLMAHFRWLDALVNQPFAFMLFLMTVIVFGISLAEAIQPRGRWARLMAIIEPREGLYAGLFLVFMGISWVYKALRMAG